MNGWTMCHVWGRRASYTGCSWGNLRERDHLEGIVIYGRMVFNLIIRKLFGISWTGLIWLRLKVIGGRLWTRRRNFEFREIRLVCWLAGTLNVSRQSQSLTRNWEINLYACTLKEKRGNNYSNRFQKLFQITFTLPHRPCLVECCVSWCSSVRPAVGNRRVSFLHDPPFCVRMHSK